MKYDNLFRVEQLKEVVIIIEYYKAVNKKAYFFNGILKNSLPNNL